MDKVIDKVAALGVPGLVLLIAMAISPWAGGAALLAALAALGGPLGALGGVLVLGLIGILSQAIATYGAVTLGKGVVERLRAKGIDFDQIRQTIDGYPLSADLKRQLLEYLERLK